MTQQQQEARQRAIDGLRRMLVSHVPDTSGDEVARFVDNILEAATPPAVSEHATAVEELQQNRRGKPAGFGR